MLLVLYFGRSFVSGKEECEQTELAQELEPTLMLLPPKEQLLAADELNREPKRNLLIFRLLLTAAAPAAATPLPAPVVTALSLIHGFTRAGASRR